MPDGSAAGRQRGTPGCRSQQTEQHSGSAILHEPKAPANRRARLKGTPCVFPCSRTRQIELEETGRVENSGGIQASLSGRYALALFELARDSKQLDSVAQSVSTLKAALSESEDFRNLTTSPVIGRDAAAKAVAAVGEVIGLDRTTRNFLGVLAQHRRLAQLPAAIRAF